MASAVPLSQQTRRHSRTPPSPRRLSHPTRLGAIEEDGGILPDIPPRAHNRPVGRMFHLGLPAIHTQELAPPPYSEYCDLTGPGGEKFVDLRNNKHITKRGGWGKLCLLALLIVIIIVALVVGLVVGLRKHKKSDVNSQATSLSAPNTSSVFPAGSYSVETFLDTIETDCTPNPSTWRCYPYTTWNQSQSDAIAIFNWIITGSSTNKSEFIISSSANPFALSFQNASLKLVDSGRQTEAYTFEVPMSKIVIPTSALTSDGSSAQCYYNATSFMATLYTKMPETNPPPTNSSNSTGGTFQLWPYAVQVQQIVFPGPGVPGCYKTLNGNVGDPIPLASLSQPGNCLCSYRNYDL